MILVCCKFPEISRFIIYYEQTVIFLNSFRPLDHGESSISRMTMLYLLLSFLTFSCDFIPSMISTNAVNIVTHWVCFPLTYKIDNKSLFVIEFLISVVALNLCLLVVAIAQVRVQVTLKNFEKIVQAYIKLLNGLKEGFIALTPHDNRFLYANKSAKLIVTQLATDEES